MSNEQWEYVWREMPAKGVKALQGDNETAFNARWRIVPPFRPESAAIG
jgi:hypothetical protein